MTKRIYWKVFRLLSNVLIISASILLGASFNHKGELPTTEMIDAALLRAPIQNQISENKFQFDYYETRYVIEPVATYDIVGLVVSHNNTTGLGDAYHTSKSIDLKDLCLVWGANLTTGVYRKLDYWSEPWTCNVRARTEQDWNDFDMASLSNNHLLSMDSRVRDTIRAVRVGDQIRMEGRLVNYYLESQPESIRKTSTNRTDTGNGACEVLMVDSIEIIKRGGEKWYAMWSYGLWCIVAAIIMKVIMFVFMPYELYKSAN